MKNGSAFLPQAFLVNPFASFTSAFSAISISNPGTSGGPSVIRGDYGTFVKLCLFSDPEILAQVKTVQLLTHGATLDHMR